MTEDPQRTIAQLTKERDALKEDIAAIEYAAHMPADYQYGLPSWINQRLYACYIGADLSEHVQQRVMRLVSIITAERDQARAEAAAYRTDWEAELAGGHELRRLLGARDNETMWGVVERVVAERDGLHAAARAIVAVLESWPPSEWGYRETQIHEALMAAIGAHDAA